MYSTLSVIDDMINHNIDFLLDFRMCLCLHQLPGLLRENFFDYIKFKDSVGGVTHPQIIYNDIK